VTKSPSTTFEEIANTISAATARATKALREASEAIAELREAEMMLKATTKAQAIVADNRMIAAKGQQPTEDENSRLAYTIPEVAARLGLHRRTIERMIDTGKLVAIRPLGRRLITAASVNALFEPGK
jgi:excisionase family DNA binding protein